MGEKNLEISVDQKRACIEVNHAALSVSRQCQLLGLNRSSWYYQAHPAQESTETLNIMQLIDQQYVRTPFY